MATKKPVKKTTTKTTAKKPAVPKKPAAPKKTTKKSTVKKPAAPKKPVKPKNDSLVNVLEVNTESKNQAFGFTVEDLANAAAAPDAEVVAVNGNGQLVQDDDGVAFEPNWHAAPDAEKPGLLKRFFRWLNA